MPATVINAHAQNKAELANMAAQEIEAEAQDPETNEDNFLYHVRDKTYEIRLIYPLLFEEYPALHQIVNEKKKDLEGFARDSERDFHDLGMENFVRYQNDIEYFIMAKNDHLISIRKDVFIFTGGAHGMYGATSLLWDVKKDKEILSPLSLFKDDMAFLRSKYCKKLSNRKAEIAISYGDTVDAKDRDSYDNGFGCPSFADLTIIFESKQGGKFDSINIIAIPYSAGPYSDGQYEIKMDIDADVAAMIKPEYRDAFK
ncbi:hypothetical protein LPB140_01340 [Sphingorhabdus lutea]|uniref:Deacetylase PdaC domain-containing protein n=2 Tax=Sphingorhabdus lutea TaxID=1913578 RepID=A0A1L3J985_9SPHN|nr:hypothetical protein LPB140_01340 [Sphingorhabdus lutea]